MKKLVRISILLFSIMMLLTMASNAFTAETSVDTDNIKVGEDVVYKVKSDEKVIATNFDISYNEKSFELVESMTPGLNVAKKDGKIACIYFDMEQNGLDEFKVKFKGVDGYQEATFNVENAKFRVASQKESYTVKNTSGLDDQNVKVTVTGMTRLMWLAIIGTGVIIMEAIILLVVGILKSKKQLKISKKLMSIILAVLMLGTLGSSVKATESDMVINFSKIGEEKIVQVMLSKDDSDRKVTKEEIIAKNNTITSIKNENGEELAGSDMVKTGDKVQTAAGTSTVVLLGDANKDGYICDTDDIMIIVNDYLGKIETDEIAKTAANLYNSDDMLDTDDIMQMMNMYLGRLEGELLTSPIENNIESEKDNVSLSLYVHSNETRNALSGRQVKVVELDSSKNEIAGTEKTYTTNENGWAKLGIEMTKEVRKLYKIIDTESSGDYTFTIAYVQNYEKYLIDTIESSISYEINNDNDIKLYVTGETQSDKLLKIHVVDTTTGENVSGRQLQITGSYAESNYDVLTDYTGTTDNNGIVTTEMEVKGNQEGPMKVYIKDLTTSETFTTYVWYEEINDCKVLKNDESVVNTSNQIFLNTAITNSSMLELRLGASESEKEVIEGNLTIHLVNTYGNASAGTTLELTVGDQTYTGTTDSNGILETGISISSSKAEPVEIKFEKPGFLTANVWFTKDNNQKNVNAQLLAAQGRFTINSELNGNTTMLEIKN